MTAPNVTLADLAIKRPGATRVFLKYGLDFCCQGRRPFDEACEKKGLSPGQILAEITAEDSHATDHTSWNSKPILELVDFIESHYHGRLRKDLPELIAMAEKVERVHAEKPTCPHGLATHLSAVRLSVLEHLAKEEEILFPMIRSGCRGETAGPIRVMEQEHEEHGRNLARLRELAADFNVPPEACTTWKALYLRLGRLADELMEHIHLENNVLFPRVLCER